MIDIIILYFLCQRIKNIVEPKGYSVGWWRFYTIITWLGFELLGLLVSLRMGKDLMVAFLSGLLCALGAYLLLQQKAKQLPNRNQHPNNWLDQNS